MKCNINIIMLTMVGICVLNAYSTSLVSAEDSSENCLIREDRIWEYYNLFGRGENPTWEIVRYKFQGTENHYGRAYHRWIAVDRDYWYAPAEQNEDGSWIWKVRYEELNRCDALLREENGIVYLLEDADQIAYYNYKDNAFSISDFIKDHEVVLYDFNMNQNDFYKVFIKDLNLNFLEFKNSDIQIPQYRYNVDCISDAEVINVSKSLGLDGNFHKVIETDDKIVNFMLRDDSGNMIFDGLTDTHINLKFVEGVGNVGWGDLINYGKTEHFGVLSITGSYYYNYDFNNQYDLEGNIIYPGMNKTAPRSGVESVKVAIPKLSVKGNSVSSTLQGSDLRITVYSVDGLMIASEQNPDTVEICGLPSGIYLVEAKAPGNTLKKKIIIR